MQRRYVRPGHCLLRRGHAVAPAALGGHDRQGGNAGYDRREERPVMELAHTCSGLGLRPAAGSVATGVSVAKNARSQKKTQISWRDRRRAEVDGRLPNPCAALSSRPGRLAAAARTAHGAGFCITVLLLATGKYR